MKPRDRAAISSPLTLVLDDVHLLHDRECRDALSVLSEHVRRPGMGILVDEAEALRARLSSERGPADPGHPR